MLPAHAKVEPISLSGTFFYRYITWPRLTPTAAASLQMSNRMLVYSLSTNTWEPVEDSGGDVPEARMNHSLVAYGNRCA
eukprot:scaffold100728_cov35-Tisochrysis_lutea.AAC.3